ncbi:legumain-like [Pygocentrus nattereri]|uniref:legumain-like n=1 Tax=Pygocentrus nattereri TaxID=42514 RepID=UPI0008142344|nr:legumain-like [Pygocentrus nattereri]
MSGKKGKQWVLLAAGSKGWTNYRHQANVCHAYQMVHCNGIPDEQVVVMMYDDVAYHKENPYPGEIINEPNGPNVYPGVLKDYTGDDVSAGNFLAVLCGDEAGVSKQAGRPVKVLKSDENDTIFVYLSDHGSAGVFAFPKELLHAADLVSTISKMAERQQFSKMVIYIESCCSGSMIDHLPKTAQVYGLSASNPHESHSACFYDEERLTFLAGEFTSCWLLHNDLSDLTRTTFQDQFVYLQMKVTQSTPCQYGNNELSKVLISNFLGYPDSRAQAERGCQAENFKVTHLTPSHEVPLIIQQKRIQREMDPEKKGALQRDYDKHLQEIIRTEKALQDIAKHACPDRDPPAVADRRPLTRLDKMKDVVEHFRRTFSEWYKEQDDAFVLSHLHVFVNLLESGVGVARIKEAITYVHSLQGL